MISMRLKDTTHVHYLIIQIKLRGINGSQYYQKFAVLRNVNKPICEPPLKLTRESRKLKLHWSTVNCRPGAEVLSTHVLENIFEILVLVLILVEIMVMYSYSYLNSCSMYSDFTSTLRYDIVKMI